MPELIQPITAKARVLLTGGLMVGLMALYLTIGWVEADSAQPTLLSTGIDDWVPFRIEWLPIYLFMLPMSWAPACTFVDRRCIKRWIYSVLLMYFVAVPLWTLWPVTVPREVVPVDGCWSFALWIMRAMDPPVNCLPSMHVAVATLAGLLIRRADPLVGRCILCLLPFIWYSTMALDQHWFLDGFAGMLIAVTVEQLTHRWMAIPSSAQKALDRRWHWAWVGPYCAVVVGVFLYWQVWGMPV